MPSVIDSLLVKLGFSIDPKGLEGFAQKTQALKSGMMAAGVAAVGAVYGIERLVRGAAERMGGIAEFSEQMGLSARSVAALGKSTRAETGPTHVSPAVIRASSPAAVTMAKGASSWRLVAEMSQVLR